MITVMLYKSCSVLKKGTIVWKSSEKHNSNMHFRYDALEVLKQTQQYHTLRYNSLRSQTGSTTFTCGTTVRDSQLSSLAPTLQVKHFGNTNTGSVPKDGEPGALDKFGTNT